MQNDDLRCAIDTDEYQDGRGLSDGNATKVLVFFNCVVVGLSRGNPLSHGKATVCIAPLHLAHPSKSKKKSKGKERETCTVGGKGNGMNVENKL